MAENNQQESLTNLSDSVEYVRAVYTNTLDWYKNADTKAQIILTLDGVFLTFITGAIFMKKSDLVEILGNFTRVTWWLLFLMALSLIGSIGCAVACLWSRISWSKRTKQEYFTEHKIQIDQIETYRPEATFFFEKISWLDPDQYQNRLLSVNKEFEIRALALDVHKLAGNVVVKHRLINLSFTLAGVGLLCFFALGLSYLLPLI